MASSEQIERAKLLTQKFLELGNSLSRTNELLSELVELSLVQLEAMAESDERANETTLTLYMALADIDERL